MCLPLTVASCGDDRIPLDEEKVETPADNPKDPDNPSDTPDNPDRKSVV